LFGTGKEQVPHVKNPAKYREKIDGIPLYLPRAEFAVVIGRSERTVARYEKKGMPVTCRGRTRLIPVDRAFKWLEGSASDLPAKGRPRNVDRQQPLPE
jgi:hypothetical protein